MLLMFSTALRTPFLHIFFVVIRSSSPHFVRLMHPEGTAALPMIPHSKITSTSMVGFPLSPEFLFLEFFYSHVFVLRKYCE